MCLTLKNVSTLSVVIRKALPPLVAAQLSALFEEHVAVRWAHSHVHSNKGTGTGIIK